MTALRVLLSRALGLFGGRRRDQELTEEIEAHLDLLTEEHVRRGVSRDGARAAARRAFGGVDQVKEAYRDQRGLPFVDTLGRDLRFAARLLVKDRWFTGVAVIALALGIGITNTVFTIVNAMVLRGLPVEHPDRIVGFSDAGGGVAGVSYRDVEDWRAATTTFTGIAAYSATNMTVRDEGRAPEMFSGSYISANAFRLVGERPILGRDFLPEDDRPGAQAVVMLGSSVWKRRYGGDPRTIGRTIDVNGLPTTVIGVMPDGFRFPLVDELWQPLALMPGLMNQRRDARVLRAFGRLADGIRMARAQTELSTIAARLSHHYPETNKNVRPVVRPFTGTVNEPIFLWCFAAAGFVLLIACANVANLLLARGAHRSREISIRASLGATRWRIVRQLLVESALLALLAGVVGFGLSVLGVRLFSMSVEGINFAYWYRGRWTMDGRVFTFLATVSLGAGFVFGLAPALHLSKATLNEFLKEAGRSGGGSRRAHWWTGALLVTELGLTLVLLAGASLMMRSFLALYRADRVVDTSHVLMTTVRLPNPKYPSPERRIAFYQRLEERLGASRAISSATLANTVPFIGAPPRQLSIDGRLAVAAPPQPTVSYVTIGSRYFETLNLRLFRGRTFTDIDGTPGHESAIVNQRFVAMYFPNEDPIGHRIRLGNANAPDVALPWLTIVGVSPTVRQQFLRELDPVVYLPHRADPAPAARLLVRARSDPAALTSLLRQEVGALDPDLPLGSIVPLDRLMTQSRWGHRVFGGMFAVFACIALMLSAVGLYAVTAYSVTQRTQEIGVRMALGAQAPQVVWLFVGRAMVPLGIGLALGLGGAFGVGRLLRGLLIQTSATDPVTLISVAALLVVVAVAACLWPARRATRLDPVAALRHE